MAARLGWNSGHKVFLCLCCVYSIETRSKLVGHDFVLQTSLRPVVDSRETRKSTGVETLPLRVAFFFVIAELLFACGCALEVLSLILV